MLPLQVVNGTQSKVFSVLGAILLLSIVLSPLAFAAPSRYHLIAIGQSHAGNTYHVLGMNSSNQVVGYITTSDSSRIAYVWRNGGISLLKPLCAGGESVAQSINDSGTIVGYAYVQPDRGIDNGRVYHAVEWKNDSDIVDLGVMGGYRGVAYDINHKGQVAGYYSVIDSSGYHEKIYLWENGVYHDLVCGPPVTGFDATAAYKNLYIGRNGVLFYPSYVASSWTIADDIRINDNGDVTSFVAANKGSSYSLVWKHDGSIFNLHDLFRTCNQDSIDNVLIPTGLNNSGQVCGSELTWVLGGYTTPTRFYFVPFLWKAPSACFEVMNGNSTTQTVYARINNKGFMAGSYLGSTALLAEAVVWQNDSMFTLDSYVVPDTSIPVHNLQYANAESDSGAIAGEGLIGSLTSAFLLVPESPKIVMPVLGKFTITLIQASATLVSDVYLYRPDSMLMIQNNLRNVGKTFDTVYPAGTELKFAICVHPPAGKGQPYWFTSDSKHARVTKANDSLMYVNFEDLPDSVADWDYNDVVLKVELHFLVPLSSVKGYGIGVAAAHRNSGWMDGFDLRGRLLGTFYLSEKGRLSNKSGLPVYGVHILRPQRGAAVSRRVVTLE